MPCYDPNPGAEVERCYDKLDTLTRLLCGLCKRQSDGENVMLLANKIIPKDFEWDVLDSKDVRKLGSV